MIHSVTTRVGGRQERFKDHCTESVLTGSDGFTEMSDDFLDWMITMLFGVYEQFVGALLHTLLARETPYISNRVCVGSSEFGIYRWRSTLDGSKDLPFINACFWEALRCCPPTAIQLGILTD
jgi:hypothetical protein